MFGPAVVRRSLAWVLTVALAIYATHYMEYHPALRDAFLTAKTFEVVALAVVTLALLVWAVLSRSAFGTIVAFVLGIFTAIYGQSLFEGNVVFFAITLTGALVLYVLTISIDVMFF
jgi:hypothetical protein